jgi:hypothetical protein
MLSPFAEFIGGSYTLASLNIDCQRCVNLLLQVDEVTQGKKRLSLVGTPGLKLFSEGASTDTGNRGEWNSSVGRAFTVIGSTVYEIDSVGARTAIGTLNTASGPVSISDNGLQLMLVDGVNGWIFTFATNLFAQITDADFPIASTVGFIDGYFLVNEVGTRNFYASSINDGFLWDALDFGVKEGFPDLLLGLVVDHREVWLIGKQTMEVWFDSGNADFPFDRIPNAFLEHGCAAVGTFRKIDNTVFWVGVDANGKGMVWKAAQYSPQRVSTFAVEQAISTYGDISTATAYTYQRKGHSFYVINFPNANTTWVFDIATGIWHERTYTTAAGAQERHRGETFMESFGKQLIGDCANGDIYEFDDLTYQDNGSTITRFRRAPCIFDNLNRVYFNELALDMETGVGLDGLELVDPDGNPRDPQIMLRYSDDQAHNWSNEHWTSMGAIGQFNARVRWLRLGQSRFRVFEVTITDPVAVVIIGAYIDVVQGGN